MTYTRWDQTGSINIRAENSQLSVALFLKFFNRRQLSCVSKTGIPNVCSPKLKLSPGCFLFKEQL